MENFQQYIQKKAVPVNIENSEIKDLYMKTMSVSVASYDFSDISRKIGAPIHDFQDIFIGYSRIGMARLLNVIAFLMKHGQLQGADDFWDKLMDALLKDILHEAPKSGVEFLLLEICTALFVRGSKTPYYTRFIDDLLKIDPYEKYDSTLERKPAEKLHNFCMYGICAEYLRGMLTGTDTDDFITRHWEVQKERFNMSGRYMDPGCPMVYDLTSRYRLALMLRLGYKGRAAGEMTEVLKKGAFSLLFQMSSDYKFPYGGRSNQFNFNETLTASMFEYYAGEFCHAGDLKTAGLFRYNAYMAVRNLAGWLKTEPARHIKNMFPTDSAYGIDSYGTYERYMGTMGTFMSGAVLFADDTINLNRIPIETEAYIMAADDEFHKIFASCKGYSIEIDAAADLNYDSNGLGRLHFNGAPVELALSMPFSPTPKYLLGNHMNHKGRSICAYWDYDGYREYLAEKAESYETYIKSENSDFLEFSVEYAIRDRGMIRENYKMDESGLGISCTCDFAPISYCIPILKNNGQYGSSVEVGREKCEVRLNNWLYEIAWDDNLKGEIKEGLLYNRNGIYRELNIINHKNSIKIKLSIKGEENEKTTRKT